MTATLREPMLLAGESENASAFEDRVIAEIENAPADEMFLPRPKSKTHQLQQGIFEHVSEHIRREPAQSTRLLEAWIGSSEERN